jgi:chromosome condensin MukBEF complex kleisin-like MukF subunit
MKDKLCETQEMQSSDLSRIVSSCEATITTQENTILELQEQLEQALQYMQVRLHG